MLPLMSNSSATLRPATSWRKSVTVRMRPRSKISKSDGPRSRTNRPFWSRTTAASRTTSTLLRKTGGGVSVALCSPINEITSASTNLITGSHYEAKHSTTEDTEDTEEFLVLLRVLCVLCGGELQRCIVAT